VNICSIIAYQRVSARLVSFTGVPRFASGKATTQSQLPSLTVSYNTPPDALASPHVQPCASVCSAASTATSSVAPQLQGSVTDADGDPVTVGFEVWDATHTTRLTTGQLTGVVSGQQASWPVPSGVLADGQTFTWRAQATDSAGAVGPWSAWQSVLVDTTPPAAPGVSSTQYPSGAWSGSPTTAGPFNFTDAASDVGSYLYGVDTNPPGTSVTAASGSASVTFTPTSGPHHLSVIAVDQAGNRSGVTDYVFNVKPGAVTSPKEGDATSARVTLQATVDPGASPHLNLKTVTRYDTVTGLAVESRMPANPSGGDAHSTKTVYYTGDASSPDTACRSRPHWANLACKTLPAAQPGTAGLPDLPATLTTYNLSNQPTTVTETVGATSRTTTTTYDPAGRVTDAAVTGGTGTALDTTHTGYDPATGRATTTSSVNGGGTTTATVTRHYDQLGRLDQYTDADSNLATIHGQERDNDNTLGDQDYKYDAAGRLYYVEDEPLGSGCVIRKYTFDADTNRTSLNTRPPKADGTCDSGAAGTTVTRTYDPGRPDHRHRVRLRHLRAHHGRPRR